MKTKKPDDRYLSAFCRELYMIIASGITADEGLEMMAEDCRDKKEKELFAGMVRAMSGGAMLSGAMREADAFPDYMTEMIGLGERTGNVDNTLKALGDYYEKQARMRESVKSAVIYPAVLLVMMLLVVGVLVIKVLPVFADVYGQMGASMPALALTIMEAGVAVGTHWYIAAGVVVLIVIGATAISRMPSMRERGFFRRTKKKIAAAHMAQALAMAMQSGMDTSEALEAAQRLTAGTVMAGTAARLKALVDGGESLTSAFSKENVFTAVERRTFSIGVRTGSADEAMNMIAENAGEEAEKAVDELVARIEPAMVVIMTVIVGVVLLSVMIPLMGVMATLM
ncbi:MAG: hypothetical protein DBX46_01430 [Clostridiales bacterium]|nr:MAG: hypothetical protein DBX46_01430 [Clostridiales bacterium]